jgi:type IV pilus assembly protein PilN
VKLIDINLLPQRGKKRTAFTYSVLGTAGVFILIALFMMLTWQNLLADIKRTDEKIVSVKKIIDLQQSKVLGAETSDGTGQLSEAVQKMMTYKVKTVPLLNELISLLPERGFIREFEYSDKDAISLTIQFDSSREAAFYLSHLRTMKWIKDTEILEITTEEIDENEAEDILPRYLASYRLHLDSGKLHALLSEKEEVE